MNTHAAVAYPGTRDDEPRIARFHWRRTIAAFLAVALLNGLLLWHFHNRYWYPVDEGVYATIAERVLGGETLHTQVQDFHPGYGDFINAAAFRLFGIDLVSLRYPLIAGAFIQSTFVFGLLRRRNVLLASCAAIASIALGVIHFLNPTPHWYALFATCGLMYWIHREPLQHWRGLVFAGVLIGVIALLHQFIGVLVGTAVFLVAVHQQRSAIAGAGRYFTRALLLSPLVVLVVYLARSPAVEFSGVLLFATWPLAMLAYEVVATRTSGRDAIRVCLWLLTGIALSSLPLVLYAAAHGAVWATFRESLFTATALGFRSSPAQPWYGLLPMAGVYQALTPSSLTDVVNGLFWATVPLLAAANGLLMLVAYRRTAYVDPIPLVSGFYAISTLYMQDAIYLFFSAGLSAVGILWWAAAQPRHTRFLVAAGTVALSAIAVVFHAAQPSTRTNTEMLRGRNVLSGTWAPPLARATLQLDSVEQRQYAELVRAIEHNSASTAFIFAVPNDAELYFLGARRNPFRFYNTGIAVQSSAELAMVLERLRTDPPMLVTFRPSDPYNTWASAAIMAYVRQHYDRIDFVGGAEFYKLTN